MSCKWDIAFVTKNLDVEPYYMDLRPSVPSGPELTSHDY